MPQAIPAITPWNQPTTAITTNAWPKLYHWGDFHILESGNLNFSVCEFMVNKKYVARGWQTYIAALLEGSHDSPDTHRARAEGKCQW